jgi:2,4-dienoyl-CoA reductase-like NADH-dependent reductase (Old Yellow Enzyme family)
MRIELTPSDYGHTDWTGRKAGRAQGVGSGGVEIHAVHGFLVSQFLSPRVSHRTYCFSGPIKARRQLLLAIVRQARSAVGSQFGIGAKPTQAIRARAIAPQRDANANALRSCIMTPIS